MKKQFMVGITLVFFALLTTGLATALDPTLLSDQEFVVTGMVEQEGDLFILQASDGAEYTVTGQDLTNMVGKKVQATGEIHREDNNDTLNINKIVEIEDEFIELSTEPKPEMPLK